MPNPYFTFKKFTVFHDKCAMKTGTDAVILGAYVKCVKPDTHILDVGTGSGIISLMSAQRFPEATITAIEIDKDAASQAADNVQKTIWKDRINVINIDFKQFKPDRKFDLVISNPPFFFNNLLSDNEKKNTARHSVELSYHDLTQGVSNLLEADGCLYVIIPSDCESIFTDAALDSGLILQERLKITTKEGVPYKRVILAFGKNSTSYRENSLTIRNKDNTYTEQYIELTKDFYLQL